MKIKYIPECLKSAKINFKNGDKVLDFKSLYQFKKYMTDNKDFNEASSSESMNYGNWSGVGSYDKYLELLDNGDEKVMDKIKIATHNAVKTLQERYEEVLTNYKFDVTGQFYDIGLVLTGVPEAWLEPEIEEQSKPQVELVINGTFPDGTNLDLIVKNAGRVLGMAKVLEDHGVEVKIKQVLSISNYNSSNREANLYVMVDIKDYDEPLNYKKCSALMSPTFLRRGGMKIMEIEAGYDLRGGYGSKLDVNGHIDLLKTEKVNELEKRLFA